MFSFFLRDGQERMHIDICFSKMSAWKETGDRFS